MNIFFIYLNFKLINLFNLVLRFDIKSNIWLYNISCIEIIDKRKKKLRNQEIEKLRKFFVVVVLSGISEKKIKDNFQIIKNY